MLNDASGFHKIYVATGYADLRRGMEGLANIIRFRFHLDPYYYTNGWIPELLTGRETAKKHCRSLRSSTQCSCRDWRLLPDTR